MSDPTDFDYGEELTAEEIEQRKQASDLEDQATNDLLLVMQTKPGRRLLYRLVYEQCGLEDNSFTGNSKTFHNEGVRSVGRMVVNDIRGVDLQLYLAMMAENLGG